MEPESDLNSLASDGFIVDLSRSRLKKEGLYILLPLLFEGWSLLRALHGFMEWSFLPVLAFMRGGGHYTTLDGCIVHRTRIGGKISEFESFKTRVCNSCLYVIQFWLWRIFPVSHLSSGLFNIDDSFHHVGAKSCTHCDCWSVGSHPDILVRIVELVRGLVSLYFGGTILVLFNLFSILSTKPWP